jgi:hypothetical protein
MSNPEVPGCTLAANGSANAEGQLLGHTYDDVKSGLLSRLQCLDSNSLEKCKYINDLKAELGNKNPQNKKLLGEYMEIFNTILFGDAIDL